MQYLCQQWIINVLVGLWSLIWSTGKSTSLVSIQDQVSWGMQKQIVKVLVVEVLLMIMNNELPMRAATVNSQINNQTRINEYGGKVKIFIICYMKNWKYDGKKYPKKVKQACSFIRKFRVPGFELALNSQILGCWDWECMRRFLGVVFDLSTLWYGILNSFLRQRVSF